MLGWAAIASLPPAVAQAPDNPNALPADPLASPSGRPPTPGGRVPADLVPALADVRDDLPTIYGDGCHLDQRTVTPKVCVFGDPSSSTTVVLFGDSHAAQWFPALERLARIQPSLTLLPVR